MPRQSTEEPVAFPGGIPYPHHPHHLHHPHHPYHPRDGYLGREMADDGWDAAVVEELGHELAELWDTTAEQPPVAGGPAAVFPAGDPVFPAAEAVFAAGDAGFPVGDVGFPGAESVFHPGTSFPDTEESFRSPGAVFRTDDIAYHLDPDDAVGYRSDPDDAVGYRSDPDDDFAYRSDDGVAHRPGGVVHHPGMAVFHAVSAECSADEAAFGPADPADRAAPVSGAPADNAAGPVGWSWRRLLSASSVLMTAVIAIAVAALGAVASYPSLRAIADGVAPSGIAGLWPLLIYGPWVVATLSILRARAYRRRTLHSWAVVIFFAAVATLLCIAKVHPSPAGIAVAGLPPLTVLLCFHQFVRQLDLATAPPPAARHAQSNRGQHRHRSAG
ncbi:DUF2637 domain-containing protein [Streptomyces paromomycinus]|uniref:DUF2637 domain-containing protein n=1 Tax=Streptomyces paromomycinus TaxID=92743 RepID=UPI001FE4D9B2|nr:DUF2637 domain-containing protein [Streptomyces paromomycinus]